MHSYVLLGASNDVVGSVGLMVLVVSSFFSLVGSSIVLGFAVPFVVEVLFVSGLVSSVAVESEYGFQSSESSKKIHSSEWSVIKTL